MNGLVVIWARVVRQAVDRRWDQIAAAYGYRDNVDQEDDEQDEPGSEQGRGIGDAPSTSSPLGEGRW
jgi:hypothetical protein